MPVFHFWGSLVAIQGIKKQQQKHQDQTEQEVLSANVSMSLSAPWRLFSERRQQYLFICFFAQHREEHLTKTPGAMATK